MTGAVDPATLPSARTLWQALESLHAVVYLAPEVTDADRALGLHGFWWGSFAGRAARRRSSPTGAIPFPNPMGLPRPSA